MQRNILHEIRKRKANWIAHILRRNCLLKQVIEGKIKGRWKWQEDEEEDVRSYWMTLRTGEDILIWRRRLCIALYGGIVLEEALDLSSDRILNDWFAEIMRKTKEFFFLPDKWGEKTFSVPFWLNRPQIICLPWLLISADKFRESRTSNLDEFILTTHWSCGKGRSHRHNRQWRTCRMWRNFVQFCVKVLTICLHFRNISHDEDKLFMLSLVTGPKDIPTDRKLQANIRDWISDWKTQ